MRYEVKCQRSIRLTITVEADSPADAYEIAIDAMTDGEVIDGKRVSIDRCQSRLSVLEVNDADGQTTRYVP